VSNALARAIAIRELVIAELWSSGMRIGLVLSRGDGAEALAEDVRSVHGEIDGLDNESRRANDLKAGQPSVLWDGWLVVSTQPRRT
jgi:hypothetical protein